MLILISPWATLESDPPSRTANADRDLVLGKTNPLLFEGVAHPVYGGKIPVNDPRLSPIYADLKNLPPTLIQIGGYELFVDEGIELLKKATADELNVTLSVYRGMPHDFAMLLPELDESVKSFIEIKNFVNLYMNFPKELGVREVSPKSQILNPNSIYASMSTSMIPVEYGATSYCWKIKCTWRFSSQ